MEPASAIKLYELEVQFTVQGYSTVKKCKTVAEATDLIQNLKCYHPEIITMKLRFYKIEDAEGKEQPRENMYKHNKFFYYRA